LLEEKVETRVASLLALVIADDVDQDCYDFALSKLTTMAIRGTMPASCAPKGCKKLAKHNKATAAKRAKPADETASASVQDDSMEFEDFAMRKEAFIAP
tara:strand:+ start:431 stop:727 length:297 start_codon:yes stop_codon:yes gene_type:complete